MVSFHNKGRIGNFLYQCFAAIGYGIKHDIEFSAPTTDRGEWHPCYLPHLVNQNYNPNLANIVIPERQHAYQELPFDESWRSHNLILDGYFQSYKYFDFCIDEVRKITKYKFEPEDNVCGIHLRRGDFLLYHEKHILCPTEYYTDGINYVGSLMETKKIKIFSDDIPFCKTLFRDSDVEFVEGGTPESDFISLMNCQAIVAANSSFSMLAGTLNAHPERIVVAPHEDVYFHPKENLDVRDMYPSDFYKIKFDYGKI